MIEALFNNVTTYPLTTLILLSTLLLLTLIIHLTLLHPLSPVPGPLHPKLTPLWLYYHSWAGTESRTLHSLHQKYGPIVRISPNTISISSGAALHDIYIAHGGFAKAACYKNFNIDGHASIFSALDPKHRAPRAKAVVHMFSTAGIRENGMETVEECARDFVERLREGREKVDVVNVLALARSFAVDAVSGYLFGRRYGGLRELKMNGKGNGMSAGAFVDTFVAVGRFFYLPNWAFLTMEWLVERIYPSEEVERSMSMVDAFVGELVKSAAVEINEEKSMETYQRRLLKAGFSEHETIAQCKDLMFAGTDSSGMNLATAVWHLARNPSFLTTLENELTTSPNPSHPLSPSTHPTLYALIHETLRISMANPTRLPRIVPAGGWTFLNYTLPASTIVGCSPYDLHFNSSIFPDPFSFRTERWVHNGKNPADDLTRMSKEMNRDWIPFGLGTRQCIARNLAMYELEVGLKHVVMSQVLRGAKAKGEKIEILEWFNSKVEGERIEICW